MSMIKAVPTSWDFGEPTSQLIKIASRGLIGMDKQAFVKRASVFEPVIEKIVESLAPGESLIHMLGLGTTEGFGPNRNGDGFKCATCRKYHPTFEKHARLYRDHHNKNPKKSYGLVKSTALSEPMQRVELLVTLFETKEAAERHGAQIADLELEKLASGEDLPTSMACSVPLDVCSGCDNKARNRREYCGPELCKKYGGLRDNLGHLFEDGHVLHADNPDPKFFDISHIHKHGRGRGADRIAFILGKVAAAEDDGVIGGAALAEQWDVSAPAFLFPSSLLSKSAVTQLEIAQRLVELEKQAGTFDSFLAYACPGQDYDGPFFATNRDAYKVANALTAAHEAKCLLPVSVFLDLITGAQKTAEVCDAVIAALPGVHEQFAANPEYESRLQHNPYLVDRAPDLDSIKWACEARRYVGISHDAITQRLSRTCQQSPITTSRVKQASTPSAHALAEEYALYQLAFLAKHADDSEARMLETIVVRNNFI